MIFVFALSLSCKSDDNVKSDAVNHWFGKQIILPNDSLIFNTRKNKSKPHLKKLKILTLIKGGCGPCVEELKEWKIFMKKVDTSQVGFIFLVHSVDLIEDFMSKASLLINYPYYYDVGHKVISKNEFSDNKLFQTFLLDENSKVILIGKPKAKEMTDLYINQIKNKLE